MSVRSYLLFPIAGRSERLKARVGRIPGCELVPTPNPRVLAVVAEAPDIHGDEALRDAIEALDDVAALVLTFGELP